MLATAFSCLIFAGPAQAQRDRVFVASYGSDSNPCTFGSPCKTFQNAVNVVAAGGEVTAIDSAGFGPMTIGKAVTITSPEGVEAGIAAPADGTAITIQAGSDDTVILSGLTLDGAGSAAAGVDFRTGSRLEIVRSIIRNYTNGGVTLSVGGSGTLYISHTLLSGNPYAVYVAPGCCSTAGVSGVLDHVNIQGSANYGIEIIGSSSTGAITFTVSDSVIANNVGNAIGVFSFSEDSPVSVDVMVRNCTIANNSIGLDMSGEFVSMWVSGSTITGNLEGWANDVGTLASYGNNNIVGNKIANTTLPNSAGLE
jgi:hypothetical protein